MRLSTESRFFGETMMDEAISRVISLLPRKYSLGLWIGPVQCSQIRADPAAARVMIQCKNSLELRP